ncbi:hypothetical protein SK128_002657, partial [Halocaridina rubra]
GSVEGEERERVLEEGYEGMETWSKRVRVLEEGYEDMGLWSKGGKVREEGVIQREGVKEKGLPFKR